METIKQSDLNKNNSYIATYPGSFSREIKVPNEWIQLTPEQKQEKRLDDMYYNPEMHSFLIVKKYNSNGNPMNYVFQIRRISKKIHKKYRTIGTLGIDFKTIVKRKYNESNENR